MFVTKSQIEERQKQMPRLKAYPATVYVRFENASAEEQSIPTAIELDIENENAIVGGYLYHPTHGVFSDGSAALFVKELQMLDAAVQLPKEGGNGVS